MNDKEIIRTSKFLSLVLRHEPERVGLKLGEAGWVGVDELLKAVNSHGVSLTLDQLKHIVATSDKKRFAFSEDGQRIRASQGHSLEVDLKYPPQTPPEILYHGTAVRFLDSTVSETVELNLLHRCKTKTGQNGSVKHIDAPPVIP